MTLGLKNAMAEILSGWQDDLSPAWRNGLGPVELGFSDMDSSLDLETWEPIFPVRRGKHFPGMPKGSHMLRAYDNIAPDQVRCLVLGQDPYPEPGFATGRAFEAGNLASWHEIDKMFSKSIRAYMQQVYAARTGNADFARSFDDWPAVRNAITHGSTFESPSSIADLWVGEGVLLLNTALTLTRFQVSIDPHQSAGHLPLWQPLMLRTLEVLVKQHRPLVILAFGDSAAETLDRAGLKQSTKLVHIERRAHPAFVDKLFAEPNPFVSANLFLAEQGLAPIKW